MTARKSQDWSMIRGDTLSFNVEIEGLEQDLTSMFFTCKTMDGSQIIFQKVLNDGCTKIAQGKYNIKVNPRDTSNVSSGIYQMDLQIQLLEDIYTILRGTLKIVEDVTHV